MVFQPQIGTQRQPNVIALHALQTKLAALNPGELLERVVIHLHQPSTVEQHLTLGFRHLCAIGRLEVRFGTFWWVHTPDSNTLFSTA